MNGKNVVTDEQVRACYMNKNLPNAVAADLLGLSYNAYMWRVKKLIEAGELAPVSHRKRTAKERELTPNITFKPGKAPAKKNAAPMMAPKVAKAREDFQAVAQGAAVPVREPAEVVEPAEVAPVKRRGFFSAIVSALRGK